MRRFQNRLTATLTTAVTWRLCQTNAKEGQPATATAAPTAEVTAPQTASNATAAPAAAGQQKKMRTITLPSVFAELQGLTVEKIQQLPVADVYSIAMRFLQHKRVVEMYNEKAAKRGERSFVNALRIATVQALPPPLVARAIWEKVSQIVEGRSVALDQAVGVLIASWPRSFGSIQRRASLFLASWIIDAIRISVPLENRPAPDPTRPPCEPITPFTARLILRNCPSLLHNRPAVVGALVQLAFEDLDTIVQPKRILAVLWAIENSKVHAPDDVWRRATKRLWALHREKLVPVHKHETYETNYAREQQGATDDKKGSVVAHRGLSVREIFRLVRVLKRERWSGDVAVLRGFVTDALRMIARNDGELRSVNDKLPAGTRSMTARVSKVTDLKPNEFISLCVIAGELGMGFGLFLDALDRSLFVPILRYHENFNDLLMICDMLIKTKCHNVEVYQAMVHRLRTQGLTNPLVLDLTLRVGKVLVAHDTLVHQLNFAPFLELLEIVASESVKMNAVTIVSYTILMFQLTRRLSNSGSHAQKLRACVDEFAFQMDRLLANGAAAVEKVNIFLEHTMMLGMRKADVANLYPNTAKLVARRNQLYKEREAQGLPFTGTVNAHPQAAWAYSKIYFLTKNITWFRMRVRQQEISQLYQFGVQSGPMHVFVGAKMFREMHFRAVPPTITNRGTTEGKREGEAEPVVLRTRLHKASRALDRSVTHAVDRVILQSLNKRFDDFNVPVPKANFTPTYAKGLQDALGADVVNQTTYLRFLSAVDRAQLPLVKRSPRLWMYIRHLGASLNVDEETQKRVDRISAKYTL